MELSGLTQVVLPVGADTAEVDCAVTASAIQVTVAGTKLMEGELAATVVPEDCTWAVQQPQVANPKPHTRASPKSE